MYAGPTWDYSDKMCFDRCRLTSETGDSGKNVLTSAAKLTTRLLKPLN